MEIKPPNRIQRTLDLISDFVRGTRLLFSLHFYKDFIGSIGSIWQLVKKGSFVITTKLPIEEKESNILFYSRFQADGDILNMLPDNIPESNLEELCNLHQKRMKQKLDSIWFAPRFLLGVLTAAIIGFINYLGVISKVWDLFFPQV